MDNRQCYCYAIMTNLCFPCQVKVHLLHLTASPHGELVCNEPVKSRSKSPSTPVKDSTDCGKCDHYEKFISKLTSGLCEDKVLRMICSNPCLIGPEPPLEGPDVFEKERKSTLGRTGEKLRPSQSAGGSIRTKKEPQQAVPSSLKKVGIKTREHEPLDKLATEPKSQSKKKSMTTQSKKPDTPKSPVTADKVLRRSFESMARNAPPSRTPSPEKKQQQTTSHKANPVKSQTKMEACESTKASKSENKTSVSPRQSGNLKQSSKNEPTRLPQPTTKGTTNRTPKTTGAGSVTGKTKNKDSPRTNTSEKKSLTAEPVAKPEPEPEIKCDIDTCEFRPKNHRKIDHEKVVEKDNDVTIEKGDNLNESETRKTYGLENINQHSKKAEDDGANEKLGGGRFEEDKVKGVSPPPAAGKDGSPKPIMKRSLCHEHEDEPPAAPTEGIVKRFCQKVKLSFESNGPDNTNIASGTEYFNQQNIDAPRLSGERRRSKPDRLSKEESPQMSAARNEKGQYEVSDRMKDYNQQEMCDTEQPKKKRISKQDTLQEGPNEVENITGKRDMSGLRTEAKANQNPYKAKSNSSKTVKKEIRSDNKAKMEQKQTDQRKPDTRKNFEPSSQLTSTPQPKMNLKNVLSDQQLPHIPPYPDTEGRPSKDREELFVSTSEAERDICDYAQRDDEEVKRVSRDNEQDIREKDRYPTFIGAETDVGEYSPRAKEFEDHAGDDEISPKLFRDPDEYREDYDDMERNKVKSPRTSTGASKSTTGMFDGSVKQGRKVSGNRSPYADEDSGSEATTATDTASTGRPARRKSSQLIKKGLPYPNNRLMEEDEDDYFKASTELPINQQPLSTDEKSITKGTIEQKYENISTGEEGNRRRSSAGNVDYYNANQYSAKANGKSSQPIEKGLRNPMSELIEEEDSCETPSSMDDKPIAKGIIKQQYEDMSSGEEDNNISSPAEGFDYYDVDQPQAKSKASSPPKPEQAPRTAQGKARFDDERGIDDRGIVKSLCDDRSTHSDERIRTPSPNKDNSRSPGRRKKCVSAFSSGNGTTNVYRHFSEYMSPECEGYKSKSTGNMIDCHDSSDSCEVISIKSTAKSSGWNSRVCHDDKQLHYYTDSKGECTSMVIGLPPDSRNSNPQIHINFNKQFKTQITCCKVDKCEQKSEYKDTGIQCEKPAVREGTSPDVSRPATANTGQNRIPPKTTMNPLQMSPKYYKKPTKRRSYMPSWQ